MSFPIKSIDVAQKEIRKLVLSYTQSEKDAIVTVCPLGDDSHDLLLTVKIGRIVSRDKYTHTYIFVCKSLSIELLPASSCK